MLGESASGQHKNKILASFSLLENKNASLLLFPWTVQAAYFIIAQADWFDMLGLI